MARGGRCWLRARALTAVAVVSAQDELGDPVYFGPVWWLIGVAPVAVAGYSSPRHVYLAAVGWAVALAIAVRSSCGRQRTAPHETARDRAPLRRARRLRRALHRSVRDWNTIAAVSRKAVDDAHRAALAAAGGHAARRGRAGQELGVGAAVCRASAVRGGRRLRRRVAIISPRALELLLVAVVRRHARRARALVDRSRQRNPPLLCAGTRRPANSIARRPQTQPELPVLFRALRDIPRRRTSSTRNISAACSQELTTRLS